MQACHFGTDINIFESIPGQECERQVCKTQPDGRPCSKRRQRGRPQGRNTHGWFRVTRIDVTAPGPPDPPRRPRLQALQHIGQAVDIDRPVALLRVIPCCGGHQYLGESQVGQISEAGLVRNVRLYRFDRRRKPIDVAPQTKHLATGVGEQVGRGRTADEVLGEMVMVAEGVKTTQAAVRLAERINVDMPISREVYRVLFENKSPSTALQDLMRRELKPETWG